MLSYTLCGLLVVLAGVATEQQRSIVDEPQCVEVRRLCTGLSENDDMLVLECLQSLDPGTMQKLSDECQNIVWNHTRALIQDSNVRDFLLPYCRNDLQRLSCQVGDPGGYLKCIVDGKDDIANDDCLNSIARIENVAFNDYRWIGNFVQHCNADIDRLRCGRLDVNGLTQSETIACLQSRLGELDTQCKKEVFRLAEMQAENIKWDKQLYVACAKDQMRFCRQFAPESGRVFNCLMQHRHDKLTHQCQTQLLRRQKLISQDYRISKGLLHSCKDDIKKSHCRRQTSDDKTIRLAQILLCLENVVKNGTKIDPDCEAEMSDHRKILMEDYRLSPEIVNNCAVEIRKYCTELQVGGKTIHCLMDHARLKNAKKRIRDVCQRALETLLKETDVAEDWRVDPVLHEACNPVVQTACRDVRGGDARVMSCLMDQIGADHMTEECEDALIQIQYFVARDFKLDPQLYRACREDAARHCHASQDWEDNKLAPDNAPLVLPCLYRYAYHEDKQMQLKDNCFDQIKRVMRQRAISVDLLPQVEEACLDDLALFCFDKTERGEEMLCLENHLDQLQDKCKSAVEEYTQDEARNVELNPYITAHCRKIMDALCPSESRNDDGEVMNCLIAHKNDQLVKSNVRCRASIEHFQLISLKDYRFSYKFKVACKAYAVRFCPTAKTKATVIACLSEKVTNDTIAGVKSDVQKECRQQLKAQLFQQRENIQYDQKLAHACEEDIRIHCRHVEPGSGQVLECLQSTAEKLLTDTCQVELFKVKKQEIMDNSVDYTLMTMCAGAIQMFCPQVEQNHVLDCLKMNREQKGFSKKCLMVVKHRIIEQNNDYRLNPSLQEHCKMDIKKFCHDVATQSKSERELNDDVIKCLKDSFRRSRLSHRCELEMSSILRDQALDLQLNPLLKALCRNELETICKDFGDENSLNAEECLKEALLAKRIRTPECVNEVANMIEESEADIHVDPLLQQACSVDLLKYCRDVEQGNGRLIKCLKVTMQVKSQPLNPECKSMLQKRLDMYKNAEEVAPPADLHELYFQVVESPAKHYFFLVLMIAVAFLFGVGMFCGRVSRRHMLFKNK